MEGGESVVSLHLFFGSIDSWMKFSPLILVPGHVHPHTVCSSENHLQSPNSNFLLSLCPQRWLFRLLREKNHLLHL